MVTAMTHMYFVTKARAAFEKAGGDPDNSGPLAEWAERARETGDSRDGVLVTNEGVIVAHTRHTKNAAGSPGAAYVTSTDYMDDTWPIVGREVGLAIGALRRLTGRDVIHVKWSEVCTGRGRPPVLPAGGIRTTSTLPPDLHATLTAAAKTNGRSLDREIAARLATTMEVPAEYHAASVEAALDAAGVPEAPR